MAPTPHHYQGCVLGTASAMGKASGTHIPKTGGKGEEPLTADCQGPAHGSTGGCVLSVISLSSEP